MTERPALDPFGQAYARLSFGLERHVPGFIDAWLGSDAERATLEPAAAPSAADLVAEAGALKDQAAALDTSLQRREDLLATMYHALGIAPDTEVRDREGRPVRICDGRTVAALFA